MKDCCLEKEIFRSGRNMKTVRKVEHSAIVLDNKHLDLAGLKITR